MGQGSDRVQQRLSLPPPKGAPPQHENASLEATVKAVLEQIFLAPNAADAGHDVGGQLNSGLDLG